jgi:glutamine amidotransferase PdxT
MRRIRVSGVEVRKPEQHVIVDSLIISDSESTTMAKLANYHGGVAPQAARAPPGSVDAGSFKAVAAWV